MAVTYEDRLRVGREDPEFIEIKVKKDIKVLTFLRQRFPGL